MSNIAKVLAFVQKHPNCTPQEISMKLPISPVNQVNQILTKLRERGGVPPIIKPVWWIPGSSK